MARRRKSGFEGLTDKQRAEKARLSQEWSEIADLLEEVMQRIADAKDDTMTLFGDVCDASQEHIGERYSTWIDNEAPTEDDSGEELMDDELDELFNALPSVVPLNKFDEAWREPYESPEPNREAELDITLPDDEEVIRCRKLGELLAELPEEP